MRYDADALPPLIDHDRLHQRIAELAEDICKTYGDEPILLVGVLKGSIFFLADLARQLGDRVSLDFLQASSYGESDRSSGEVRILKDLDQSIEGKHVLIVEDIVDTGLTLSYLKSMLLNRRPLSLRVVSLLSKPEARIHSTLVDFVGFEIANEFVVGYGLDFAERYRNLPYIAVLRTSA